MLIFESEADLLKTLDEHEAMIARCVSGKQAFWDFYEDYDSFYWRCALHGDESDEEELLLLKKHHNRIEVHRIIDEDILGMVCSDADAPKQAYIDAGRYGSSVALEKLKEVARDRIKKKVTHPIDPADAVSRGSSDGFSRSVLYYMQPKGCTHNGYTESENRPQRRSKNEPASAGAPFASGFSRRLGLRVTEWLARFLQAVPQKA